MITKFGIRPITRILGGTAIATALLFGALPEAAAATPAPPVVPARAVHTPVHDGYWWCNWYYSSGACGHWQWIWQYQWRCTQYYWDGTCRLWRDVPY
ncbi:hypothetical protein [Nocardia macrotermitis]|uniref:Uncharacterized protein n=1 Tax=Nocardia macrotermitis TaxID=2585198 RepID=A0A7K0DEF8_9NOCA|nr:hypothetical protein [Nocardia macrotermitis]MQY24185.1 hypothetical protein [Nocardia macrotermitis]